MVLGLLLLFGMGHRGEKIKDREGERMRVR